MYDIVTDWGNLITAKGNAKSFYGNVVSDQKTEIAGAYADRQFLPKRDV
jgi:hypothetical protein